MEEDKATIVAILQSQVLCLPYSVVVYAFHTHILMHFNVYTDTYVYSLVGLRSSRLVQQRDGKGSYTAHVGRPSSAILR